jgi:hypothetical protein
MRLTPFQENIVAKMKDGWSLYFDTQLHVPWISKSNPSPNILHSLRWLRRDTVKRLERAGMISWTTDGSRRMIAHLIEGD